MRGGGDWAGARVRGIREVGGGGDWAGARVRGIGEGGGGEG